MSAATPKFACASLIWRELPYLFWRVTLDFEGVTLGLGTFSTAAPAVPTRHGRDIYHSIELNEAVRMVYATCRASHCRRRYCAVSRDAVWKELPYLFWRVTLDLATKSGLQPALVVARR